VKYTSLDEPTFSEEDGIRYLHFGSTWVQGAMDLCQPDRLVLEYTRQMMAWLLFRDPAPTDKVAMLGLGAAGLLRFTMAHTPVEVHSIERNARVIQACEAWFDLPTEARSYIHHQAAEAWLPTVEKGSFHVLQVDLYDAHAQGPVCDSVKFYKNCHRILRNDGLMLVNLFGNHASYDHNVQRIQQVFDGNVICLPPTFAGNVIALGFAPMALQQQTVQQVLDRAKALEQQYNFPAMHWARHILSSCHTKSTSGVEVFSQES